MIIVKKRALSWLHLADLQIGGQNTSLGPLLNDIEAQMKATETRPDFIAVTGDIAFSGQQKQYQVAMQFFDVLLERVGLGKDRLFIVPGNHDVDRHVMSNTKNIGERQYTEQEVPPENTFDDSQTDVLNNYARFIEEYLGEFLNFTSDLAFHHKYSWNGRSVAIMGLNTALLDDPNLLANSSFNQQVEIILNKVKSADIRIALLHHPMERLQRSDVSTSRLIENSDFVLHSHLHSINVSRVVERHNQTIVIQGGSNYAESQHPNAYNLVKLDFESDKGHIYLRRYEPKQKLWSEAVNKQSHEGEYIFELPKRLITLLQSKFQKAWTPPLAGYTTDTATGDDKLGITTEVDAFSSVIAYKNLRPPLCLGVFGDWGSGKTFFMRKMSVQIGRLAEAARYAKEKGQETDYCANIVQINFNAWHYVDANLWACLVNHIFEELDAFIEEKGKKEKRKHLLKELKLATKAHEEAENKKEAAEQRVGEIEERLEKARQERAKTSIKLRDLLAEISLDEILDKNQREQLRSLSQTIGLPETYHRVEDLNAALDETRSLWGRLRVALLAPKNRGLGLVWLLIMLIAIPLVGICVDRGLNWLMDFPDLVDTATVVLLQVAAFSASVYEGLNRLLKRTSPMVDELESVLASARERAQDRRQENSEEESKLLGELEISKNREAAASQALVQAQLRVEEAELALKQLETTTDERRLAEFIQERVASEDYKKHLGIISTIREDLEFLSQKLSLPNKCDPASSSDDAEAMALPCIDRIVLYIDDLDRCPEERVVEVLQAVHLLLAFKLFVVVVGVDSRWLLRSLEESYATLRISEKVRAGWSEEEI